jgi:hypothetical protein
MRWTKARQIAVGLCLVALLVWVADARLSADWCQKQCSCVNLVCGGEGCTCSSFSSSWFACGFLDGQGGCDWDCGNGGGRLCCSDYCSAG